MAVVRVKLSENESDFTCYISNSTISRTKEVREQMDAMMGGYSISRKTEYNESTYAGPVTSLDWLLSIFRMYGYEICVADTKGNVYTVGYSFVNYPKSL